MKSLLLVRHAKSSWDHDVDDFDRPLNERGKGDAPKMAERLIKKDIKIDAFIASPAKRALTTANYFAKAWDKKQKDIIVIPYLYEPTVNAFTRAIETISNSFNTVAIFSHNPGITDFANKLSANTTIDNMPTCSVFAVKADISDWKDFESGTKTFWFFDYPKSH